LIVIFTNPSPHRDLLAADLTSTYVGHYSHQRNRLTIRNLASHKVEDSFDITCHDLGFLPSISPQKTLLIVREDQHNSPGERSFYLWPLDRYIPNLPPFSSCLRVSQYPPDILFGYISNGSLLIYELVLESDLPSAFSIRQYTPDHFTFLWFDFANGLPQPLPNTDSQPPAAVQVAAIRNKDDQSANFDLRWYSLVHCKDIGRAVLLGEFIDAAVSPVDPNRLAVLTANHLTFYARLGIEEVTRHFVHLNCPVRLERILWSPFGSRVKLIDRNAKGVLSFVEVSANLWCGEHQGGS
jgi:hypothetical protein